MTNTVTNVVFAGLGGQGVLKASDIFAKVVMGQGVDVKKSEIHGMSQRGGSVTSDVRFGSQVFSPMVPEGRADYVVVLADEEVEGSKRHAKSGGVIIPPAVIDIEKLPNKKSFNIAMLGVLSSYLDISESAWLETIKATFSEKFFQGNEAAFMLGRSVGKVGQTV